jgi:hypothetical protein
MTRVLAGVALVASAITIHAAADPPRRKPLDPKQRAAVLAMVKAVDLAQATDIVDESAVEWDSQVFKSGGHVGYVPFRVGIPGGAAFKPTAMYVRAVSRHDGMRAMDEHSRLRDWILKGGDVMPRMAETMVVGIGEMPVGGLASASTKQNTAAAAAASGALMMQQRDYEKQKKANDDARKREETHQLEPFLFPFEDYFFFDAGAHIERALALPPGEYDVFTGLVDRDRVKTSTPVVVKRTVTIPDFWSDELRLSSLLLAKDLRTLPAPLAGEQQVAHPYAFGRTEIIAVPAPIFRPDDTLTVVYQMCNYGAPDSDLTALYSFYRIDGGRRLFNHTDPQFFADGDLPEAGMWETQAFATQTVPLQSFPPGEYELEVTVRDRLTRAAATGRVTFTVAVR